MTGLQEARDGTGSSSAAPQGQERASMPPPRAGPHASGAECLGGRCVSAGRLSTRPEPHGRKARGILSPSRGE